MVYFFMTLITFWKELENALVMLKSKILLNQRVLISGSSLKK